MTTVATATANFSVWTGATSVTLQQFSSTTTTPTATINLRGFTPAPASKKQIALTQQRVNGGSAIGPVTAAGGLTFRLNNGISGPGVGTIFTTTISDNGITQLKSISYKFDDFSGVSYSQVSAYLLELT
jgi:hypothetical protein